MVLPHHVSDLRAATDGPVGHLLRLFVIRHHLVLCPLLQGLRHQTALCQTYLGYVCGYVSGTMLSGRQQALLQHPYYQRINAFRPRRIEAKLIVWHCLIEKWTKDFLIRTLNTKSNTYVYILRYIYIFIESSSRHSIVEFSIVHSSLYSEKCNRVCVDVFFVALLYSYIAICRVNDCEINVRTNPGTMRFSVSKI